MLSRIKSAWAVLRGRLYIPWPGRYYPPDQIVQIIYFRDHLLGLDASGAIWDMDIDSAGRFSILLLTENPIRGAFKH